MSEASAPDKKAIQQQASAMLSSVTSQERVIKYLRSLDLPDDNDSVQELAQTIDDLQSARQDLVNHFEFLGVAHDHGWDAARIFRDEPDEASKRVQSAVNKARKKKEADDREKKKKASNKKRTSSSSGGGSSKRRHSEPERSGCSHSHASTSSHSCCNSCYGQQPYQRQFRSGQNLPCIRCGDTAHHWRQCPKPATK